jgi:hypothetical protein
VSPQQRRLKIQQTQLTEQQQPATSSSPPTEPADWTSISISAG